jgi:hypothetical protein
MWVLAIDRNERDTRNGALALALSLAVALHLVAIYFFSIAIRTPANAELPRTRLAVHLVPLPERERVPQTRDQSTPRTPVKRATSPPVTGKSNAPAVSTRKAQPPSPPASPRDRIAPDDSNTTAPATPSTGELTDDLLARAKRDVGKIDRDLRNASPKYLQGPHDSPQRRLERGIAAAGKVGEHTLLEKVYPNGRRVTKVSGPGGEYCVTYEGVGATDGVDQIQRGIHGKVIGCGHLFDAP